MDDALVVQLEIRNFAQAMAQIRQFSQAVKAIPNPIGGRGGGGGGGGASTQASVARAAANNVSPAMRQFKNMISSMRVGFNQSGGMSLMPLVGRMQSFLMSMGPLGIAAGLAASAIGIMAAAANHAAEVLGNIRQTELVTGGTAKETMMAQALGSNLGIDPNAVSGAFKNFQQEMASPEAMAAMPPGFARPMGAGPFNQDPNWAKTFLGALDHLRNATDTEARQMMRAAPSLEAFAQLRDMTDQEYQAMRKDVEQRAEILANPETMRIQREYRDNLARVNRHLSDFATLAGTRFMQFFNWLLDSANKVTDAITNWAGSLMGKNANKMFQSAEEMRMRKQAEKANKSLEKHIESMDEHSDAMNDHTQALKGIYGGGERARGALPGAYGGNFSSPGVMPALRQAVNLGALAI